nr:MAG: replication initiator protein [Microvirus sp.]
MPCDTPFYVQRRKWDTEKVPVPCGKCPACKFRRVNEWVFRLMKEEEQHTCSSFITLTYDTRHVPISAHGYMTLRKKDFQDYMKRLRKLCPGAVIKYYAVGEYGGRTHRPHYHAIVFGVHDTEDFFRAWHLDGEPIGSVHVGQVSQQSIAYTMKYIDKPHYIRKHARDDRAQEFSLMSKGLGSSYITDVQKQYHRNGALYLTKRDGYRVAMPRYYRTRIWTQTEMSVQVDQIRAAVEQREHLARRSHRVFGFSYDEYKEHAKIARFSKFYSSHQQKRDII